MANLCYRYSSMNAGKSTALLQAAYNYEEQGRRVLLYAPAFDDRYGTGRITSRLGIGRDALLYDEHLDFLAVLSGVDGVGVACLFVDEAEFLTEAQVVQLHRVAQTLNVPVICYGLRSDFRGLPFAGSAFLLSLADELEELKTTCACSRKATMNIRLDATGARVRDGEQVEIGGNLRYRQVCASCFYRDA